MIIAELCFLALFIKQYPSEFIKHTNVIAEVAFIIMALVYVFKK